MPVPRKIPTMSRGFPLNSTSCTPRVQMLQSFSIKTGTPSCVSSIFLRATSFHPRFPANMTLPVSESTEPGEPIPTALICLRLRSHSSTASCTQRAIRSTTASGPRSALVLILERPRHLRLLLKTPERILVPPMSTPTKYSCLAVSEAALAGRVFFAVEEIAVIRLLVHPGTWLQCVSATRR